METDDSGDAVSENFIMGILGGIMGLAIGQAIFADYKITSRLFHLMIAFIACLIAYCFMAYDAKGDSPIVLIYTPNTPPATGVILGVEKDFGILVTAGHVADLGKLRVRDHQSWYETELIGSDKREDLAALKVIGWKGPTAILSELESTREEDLSMLGAKSGYRQGKVAGHSNGIVISSFPVLNGDSGAPFIVKERVIGIVSSAIASGGIPVSGYGPDSITIQQCLGLWGWNCSGGKCRRINPPTAWTPQPVRIEPGGTVGVASSPIVPPPQLIPIPGPRGLQGLPGKSITGPIGPPGPPGEAASVDLRDFPPFRVEFLGENGQVVRTQIVPAGGTLQIPPFTMTWTGPDGRVVSKTRPLGGQFNWKYFEKER